MQIHSTDPTLKEKKTQFFLKGLPLASQVEFVMNYYSKHKQRFVLFSMYYSLFSETSFLQEIQFIYFTGAL